MQETFHVIFFPSSEVLQMLELLQDAATHQLFVLSQVGQGKSGCAFVDLSKHQEVKQGVAAGNSQEYLILGDLLCLRLQRVL